MDLNISMDFSHLENGFITKRRHQNIASTSGTAESKSESKFKCPLCPKYYIQFGQALSTHLVNKHSYTDVALKEFFGNCYYAGREESSKNFHCEFCQRNFKGKKWLINHISTTHCNYLQSPHLHRLLVEPSLNEIVSKKARRKLTKAINFIF